MERSVMTMRTLARMAYRKIQNARTSLIHVLQPNMDPPEYSIRITFSAQQSTEASKN